MFVSLIEARQHGLTRYFTGKPCANGHVAERLVSSRSCIACGKERLEKYNEKNRDQVLAKKRAAQKIYIEKNPEKIRATRKATVAKHRERRNLEKLEWRKRNSGKVLALTRKRQLAKRKRTPFWLTPDDFWMMSQAYEIAALRTKIFGFQWHVDHIIPLQGDEVSGLHVPSNLQVIPWYENTRKGNRMEVA